MDTSKENVQNNDYRKKEEAENREKEFRSNILAQVLSQDARARFNQEKADMIEKMLINMVRSGRLGSKLSEDQFVQILHQISSTSQKSTTVKFDRRRAAIDSDDDFDLDD